MKQRSQIVAYICLIAVVSITSLALLTNRFGWPLYLEIFSHFQVQYFAATLLLVTIPLLLRHIRIFLIGLFCSAILSAQVLPWYLPSSFISHDANFRVLVANLHFSNNGATRTLALMNQEQPDLALFIEVNRTMDHQLDRLKDTLPYSSHIAAESGLVVYSKYPLTNPEIQPFGRNTRDSLVAHLEVAGQALSLVAVHPLPPMEPQMFQARNTLLADVSKYVQTQTDPVVLLGDLNVTMWSPYYQALIRQTHLKNTRQGFGIRPTWPRAVSYYGLPTWSQGLFKPLQIPIDHCLVSSDIRVSNTYTGTDTGSDHAPLVVDLAVDNRTGSYYR